MGNYMSNNSVYLLARRTLMRYNAENRALKELEKQTKRPVVAPKHDAGIIDYHKSLKENQEYLSKANVLNKDLDDRLKDVYVKSTGVTENLTTSRPLPEQRYTETFDIGYKESNKVPPGKVSLLQAIKFITDHRSNPAEWPIERIAEENKIKVDVASDIVKYYQAFEVFFSKDVDQKKLKTMQKDLKLLGAKDPAKSD